MNFYRAFEERHRGSRAVIKERLRAYTPFLQPVLQAMPGGSAVDLGCGRGEWLELLGELGFRAHGVDLDDAMLEGCRSAGLSAERGEAIAFLRATPDASQAVVSAFHLVEHLPFEEVQTLVSEAKRVLAPGGLLILETPNPENILVATSGFYLDPTHRHPLPPELLSFLPEYAGYARVKTVRLQEPKALHEEGRGVSLLDVLGSASPDYGVVAQKEGQPERMQALDSAFALDFGIGVIELAKRYDTSRRSELGVVEDHANRLAEQARAFQAMLTKAPSRTNPMQRLELDVQALRERLADTDARLAAAGTLVASLMDELQQEESKRRELEDLLVYRTGDVSGAPPLASLVSATTAGSAGTGPAPASGAGAGTGSNASWLERHPELRLRIVGAARRLRVDGLLRRAYRLLLGRSGAAMGWQDTVPPDLPPATVRAREIQQTLKGALDPKNRKTS